MLFEIRSSEVSIFSFSIDSISFLKIIGSITTPLPIKLVTPALKIPEGIVCSTCLIPSNSSVAAFGPP